MGSDFPSEKLQGNKENEDGGGAWIAAAGEPEGQHKGTEARTGVQTQDSGLGILSSDMQECLLIKII